MSTPQTPYDTGSSSQTPFSQSSVDLSDPAEKVLIKASSKLVNQASGNVDAEKFPRYGVANIVDWDGPNDPENPMNWSNSRKWLTIGLISLSSFNVSMVSTIFAPGVPQVLEEFHTNDSSISSLMVSIYVMGAAVGPVFLTPLTEMSGRLPITHVAHVLFVVAAAIGGGSVNTAMLIVARFFMGVASAVPCTVGGGFIADLIPVEKRGTAMTIWSVGLLLGLVTGPIFGGYMAMTIGWRWTIWLEAILGAFITITSLIFLRETYPPTLLRRKAIRLQKATGEEYTTKFTHDKSLGRMIWLSISRPIKLLILSPIVLFVSLFCSVAYSYMYILFTTFTSNFENIYGFNAGQAGLAYLGLGLGFAVGQLTVGYFSDRYVQKQKARYGETTPEDRLPPIVLGVFLIPIGLVWYGWSAEYQVHWIVPIMGTFFIGVGIYYVNLVTYMYLVDAFTLYAASAASAESFLRSIFGAVLPLAGPALYSNLGMGWGNTLLAIIAVAFAPTSFLLVKYGGMIRTNPRFQPTLA